MGDYPEHDKLSAIKDQSQACGEFLEWLGSQGILLCSIPPDYDHTWLPIHRNVQDLLAEFFEIDLDKIEVEKRQMLDQLRAAAG